MNSTQILIYICIFVIILFILYDLSKYLLAKTIILYGLSKFNKGNFIIIDEKNNELIKVINEPLEKIPIVKVNNQTNFFYNIYNKSELGLGESYMNRDWESDDLIGFLNSICLNETNPNIPKISLKNILSSSSEYDK